MALSPTQGISYSLIRMVSPITSGTRREKRIGFVRETGTAVFNREVRNGQNPEEDTLENEHWS